MKTPDRPSPLARAALRDMGERAMSIRIEQAAVPPSRGDRGLIEQRTTVARMRRYARNLWPCHDRRLP